MILKPIFDQKSFENRSKIVENRARKSAKNLRRETPLPHSLLTRFTRFVVQPDSLAHLVRSL